MFYCREDGLHRMNRRYDKNRFECIVIYGRHTAPFRLQALTYKEMTVFHPDLTLKNQAL